MKDATGLRDMLPNVKWALFIRNDLAFNLSFNCEADVQNDVTLTL